MINLNFATNYYGLYYIGDKYLFILAIAVFVISIIAQIKVKTTYSKYSKVFSRKGITAVRAARSILDANGLYNVQIARIPGNLTDNFNPKTNVVSLSDSVFGNSSVAAIGVAAHEVGHAIQHAENYIPIRVRNSILPMANFGTSAGVIIFMLGLVFSLPQLMYFGIILFSFIFLFQLVTLPVEFNASRRALRILTENGMLDSSEIKGSRKVLTAAAMTYVAAMLSTLVQLLRLIALARRNKR